MMTGIRANNCAEPVVDDLLPHLRHVTEERGPVPIFDHRDIDSSSQWGHLYICSTTPKKYFPLE